jgi:hypothetical protein
MTNRALSFPSSPVGYVFRPTDEELVNHYLRLKMHGGYEQEVSIIAEVNVCDFEPWVLPGTCSCVMCNVLNYFPVYLCLQLSINKKSC